MKITSMKQPSARSMQQPSAPLYPDLEGEAFRLSQIGQIRNALESQSETHDGTRRRHKAAYNTFLHVSTGFNVISAACGAAAVATLATGVGGIVAVPLSCVALVSGGLSACSGFIQKAIIHKVEKHDRIKMTAEGCLDTINGIVSKALADNKISDEEYQLVLKAEKAFREKKAAIRQTARLKSKHGTSDIADLKKQLIEEGRQQGLSELKALLDKRGKEA